VFTQRKSQKSFKDLQHEKAVERELQSIDFRDAPECSSCGVHYSPRRRDLGYTTCLDCGSPKKVFAVVPVPKSNYVIATSISQLASPYSHKGNK
jgi:uncharacterized OB-fold protein